MSTPSFPGQQPDNGLGGPGGAFQRPQVHVGFDAFDGFGGPTLPNAGQGALPDPTGGRRRGQDTADKVSRMLQFEGPRGKSVRAAVWLRYLSYAITIILCSAFTEAFVTGAARGGGKWMFFASAVMICVASVATFFFPHLRPKIIAQLRQYMFGITVLPGTGIAFLMYLTRDVLGGDAFANTFTAALPIVFLVTVGFPVLIFIKVMSDLRTLHKANLDDQEMVSMYSRQDGLQR
jgi:hypothetical protein